MLLLHKSVCSCSAIRVLIIDLPFDIYNLVI